jgi:hypothetical protein
MGELQFEPLHPVEHVHTLIDKHEPCTHDISHCICVQFGPLQPALHVHVFGETHVP